MADFSDVDVVVPIYNEEGTVPELVRRLRSACPGATLIFVDNASRDRTCELLEAEGDLVLVRHATNEGYGASLLDGVRAGTGDKIIMIDADLEYPPEDIPALVEALGHEEAVFGSRFIGPHAARMELRRAWGNRALTSIFNLLFRQHLTDFYTGVRAYWRRSLPVDEVERTGFDFMVELSARMAGRGVRFAEVPVRYHPRKWGSSKMQHLREFAKFLFWVVRDRLFL